VGEAWRTARETARENPLSMALLGAGIAALFGVRRRREQRPLRRLRGNGRWSDALLGRRRGSRLSAWIESAGEVGAPATRRARAVTSPLREAEVATRAQQQARRVRRDLEVLTEKQPLLLVAACVALGALLGGAFRSGRS